MDSLFLGQNTPILMRSRVLFDLSRYEHTSHVETCSLFHPFFQNALPCSCTSPRGIFLNFLRLTKGRTVHSNKPNDVCMDDKSFLRATWRAMSRAIEGETASRLTWQHGSAIGRDASRDETAMHAQKIAQVVRRRSIIIAKADAKDQNFPEILAMSNQDHKPSNPHSPMPLHAPISSNETRALPFFHAPQHKKGLRTHAPVGC